MLKNENKICLVILLLFCGTSLMAQTIPIDTIWSQMTWRGGPFQLSWSDTNKFYRHEYLDYNKEGEISLIGWKEVNIAVSEVHCLLESQDDILFCTTHRAQAGTPNIFKSTDGNTWQPAIDYPIIDQLTDDTLDLDKMYFVIQSSDGVMYSGGGEGKTDGFRPYVLKSTDGGNQWKNTGVLPDTAQIVKTLIETSDGDLYAGTLSEFPGLARVYKSVDEGETWITTDTVTLISIDVVNDIVAVGGDTLYIGTRCEDDVGRVLVTTDGGAHWDTTGSMEGAIDVLCLVSVDDVLYAGVTREVGGFFKGALLKSNDGYHWELASDLDGTYQLSSLLWIDGAIYAGTSIPSAKLYKSDDYGLTWESLPRLKKGEKKISDLLHRASGELFVSTRTPGYVCEYLLGGLLGSSIYDTKCPLHYGIMNWTNDENLRMKARTSFDKEMIVAPEWEECDTIINGQDISSLNSVNDSDRYIQFLAEFVRLDIETPILYSVSIDYSVPYDTIAPIFDSTTVWSTDSASLGGPFPVSTVFQDDLSGPDIDNVYLYWSNDNWYTQNDVKMVHSAGKLETEIPCQSEGDSVWYYLAGMDLRNNDAVDPLGAPAFTYCFWIDPQPPRFSHTTILHDTSYPGPYLVACYVEDASLDLSSVILHWRFNEGIWDSVCMDDYPASFFADSIPSVAKLAENTKIDYYLSARDTLNYCNTDPPEAPWGYYSFYHISTGLAENRLFPWEASGFSVLQNAPNPFRERSVINYWLPVKTHVTLEVLDCTGRIIKVLVNKEQSPGHYSLPWNGKDKFDRRTPSGAYFYRFRTPEFSTFRKMIIMR